MTFKRDKHFILWSPIRYPFWISWRHTAFAIVSKEKFFCVKQLGTDDVMKPKWQRPALIKSCCCYCCCFVFFSTRKHYFHICQRNLKLDCIKLTLNLRRVWRFPLSCYLRTLRSDFLLMLLSLALATRLTTHPTWREKHYDVVPSGNRSHISLDASRAWWPLHHQRQPRRQRGHVAKCEE